MIQKQYDVEYGDNPSSDWDTNIGDILYTKDGPNTPEKKESALTVWHWCTIVICVFMVVIGIVYNDYLIVGIFILTGYFEIRTALLYHDIQQLQKTNTQMRLGYGEWFQQIEQRLKSLENGKEEVSNM